MRKTSSVWVTSEYAQPFPTGLGSTSDLGERRHRRNWENHTWSHFWGFRCQSLRWPDLWRPGCWFGMEQVELFTISSLVKWTVDHWDAIATKIFYMIFGGGEGDGLMRCELLSGLAPNFERFDPEPCEDLGWKPSSWLACSVGSALGTPTMLPTRTNSAASFSIGLTLTKAIWRSLSPAGLSWNITSVNQVLSPPCLVNSNEKIVWMYSFTFRLIFFCPTVRMKNIDHYDL